MKEIFKSIPDHPGYKASNFGRIKSFKRYKDGRFLKPHLNRCGYATVNLCHNGKKKLYTVHLLILKTYILNVENLPQCNHKNGIKHCNRLSNLEWVSASKNLLHAFRVLKRKPGRSKLNLQKAEIIRDLYQSGNITHRKLSIIFNVTEVTIWHLINMRTWINRSMEI